MGINLGDEATDTITGYTGIVIGITEWLNGCRRIGIQLQTLDKDHKPHDVQWFDEQQVGVQSHAERIADIARRAALLDAARFLRLHGERDAAAMLIEHSARIVEREVRG